MTWVAKSEKYTVPSGAMTRPSARPTIDRSNAVGVLAAQLVAPEIGVFGAPSFPELLLELLLQPSHSTGTRAQTRIGRRLLIIVLLRRWTDARGEGRRGILCPFPGCRQAVVYEPLRGRQGGDETVRARGVPHPGTRPTGAPPADARRFNPSEIRRKPSLSTL